MRNDKESFKQFFVVFLAKLCKFFKDRKQGNCGFYGVEIDVYKDMNSYLFYCDLVLGC